jgi:hypothetical protein
MYCIIFLRVYWVWRVYFNYSLWMSEKAYHVCIHCYCKGGKMFAIKAEMKERPFLMLFIIFFSSIVIFGFSLRAIERCYDNEPIPQDWESMWNGMWCIIITMTTVGYGDYYPQTTFGRILGVLACLWGNFLISLIVVALTGILDFKPQEDRVGFFWFYLMIRPIL